MIKERGYPNEDVMAYAREQEELTRKSLGNPEYLSEEDKQITNDIAWMLRFRLADGAISQGEYDQSIQALSELVPHRNEKDQLMIGDVWVNRGREALIQSRVDAHEADIFEFQGSWARMPVEVKEEIIKQSSLLVEMTSGCTVGCNFCGLAQKGKVTSKLSFDSVKGLIDLYAKKPPSFEIVECDMLYWGTDPFDVKWSDGRSFIDVYDYYKSRMNNGRYLYTSTAIPVGEELKVLQFAYRHIGDIRRGSVNHHYQFRISRTNQNWRRAELINTVIRSLVGELQQSDNLEFSRNRNDTESRATEAEWKKSGPLDTWDVIGPNCKDSVITTPQEVVYVVMQAGSNHRPNGELREPVMGKRLFKLPVYQEKPVAEWASKAIIDAYPDSRYIVFYPDTNGNLQKNEYIDVMDPHRALLRIVAMYTHILSSNKVDQLDSLNFFEKRRLRRLIRDDWKRVNHFLREDNITFRTFKSLFNEYNIV